MSGPVLADTGGLLKALAQAPDNKPSFPEYQAVLTTASAIIVPALVLTEVDYFLRENRAAMRKLVAEIFDPKTRYVYELPLPSSTYLRSSRFQQDSCRSALLAGARTRAVATHSRSLSF